MEINVVFFTVKNNDGTIKVVDDVSRNYGVFNTEEEAKSKINELYDFVGGD